jgi:predicted lipid-binding transport protein (Tim44 family)
LIPFLRPVLDLAAINPYIRSDRHSTNVKRAKTMNSSLIQLIVLAAVAIFLIIKLRAVLGTREGFEKPAVPVATPTERPKFEVIEGGQDRDILDNAAEGSATALALSAIKSAEPKFNTGEFLRGARGAYEMILMAFERGDLTSVRGFISDEVAAAFDAAIAARGAGTTVQASFVGIRELALAEAEYDKSTKEAELTVRFVGELTSVTKDATGHVVAGAADQIKRQRDIWTFARSLGSNNPNWLLVATAD